MNQMKMRVWLTMLALALMLVLGMFSAPTVQAAEIEYLDLSAEGSFLQSGSCNLEVDKTCVVTPAPPTTDFQCSDIDLLSMTWDGAQAVKVVAHSGNASGPVLATVDNVQPGDTVTVSGYDGSTNDNTWEIFAAGTNSKLGESVFHISCSDNNMDGETDDPAFPNDCGKAEGNGKDDDAGLLNDWLFEGLGNVDGTFVSCTPKLPPPADACNAVGPAEVTYFYEVTNLGAALSGVNLNDDQLGTIAGPINLANGETQTFDRVVNLIETTTNVATASGTLAGGGTCQAPPDTVTVTVEEPCFASASPAITFDNDKVTWALSNLGTTALQIQRITVNWPEVNGALDEVKLGSKIHDGDFAPPAAVIESGWAGNVDDRTIDPGKTETLELKFLNTASQRFGYNIIVEFTEGCPAQVAYRNAVDYGDAPDPAPLTGPGNYNTTALDDGPSHSVVNGLQLGNWAPDADDGTLQSMPANADDTTDIDDEDGVTSLPLVRTDSSAVDVPLRAVNDLSAGATLRCFLDFNRDGDFTDPGEGSTTAAVPAGSGMDDYIVSFGGFAAPVAGESYLRCRIAADAAQVDQPTGMADTGEVEDYRLQIRPLQGPGCDLILDKTCLAPPPPPSSDYECKDLDALSMEWNGTQTVKVRAWRSIPGQTLLATFDDVAPGDIVTVSGYDGASNDNIWEIFQAGSNTKLGESQFHISCSDDQMDGSEDCGLPQGNGKSNDSGLLNDWLLEGLGNADGTSFQCTPPSTDPQDEVTARAGDTVTYFYKVTNQGDDLTAVNITDDKLGAIAGPFSLASGAMQTFQQDAVIDETTVNTAFAFATLPGGAACQAVPDQCTVNVDEPCDICKGGVNELTFEYQGDSAANVVIYDKDSVDTSKILFQETVQPGEDITILPRAGEDKFNNDISIYVNGVQNAVIHTSCSKPIGSNLVVGDFLITRAFSVDNGLICPLNVCDSSASPVLVFDGKKIKWDLSNLGEADLVIDSVTVTWPAANGTLNKGKLSGDFFAGVLPPTAAVIDGNWDGNVGDRTLKVGDTKTLELEFANDASLAGPYTIIVEFEAGCPVEITYIPDNAPTDLGDAPDDSPGTSRGDYNTRDADNGPNHAIVDGVYLGNVAPDSDDGTLQNVAADADDTTNTDDEDGLVSLPPIDTTTEDLTAVVRATNDTDAPAYLRCFIDMDRNGRFNDAGETSTLVTVPANAGSGNYNVGFSGFAAPVPGDSYIRCRIAYLPSEVSTPVGAAASGEIEDEPFTIVANNGAIGNYVWVDENSDGLQDAGEPGIPNVVVVLYDDQGNEVGRTVTDTDGGYLFDNLPAGDYFVDVLDGTDSQPDTLPAGLTQTPPSTLPGADFGNQDHGTDPIPNTGFTGYPVTLDAGEENLTADFGYNYNEKVCVDDPSDANCTDPTAVLGDRVWIDADGDGVQDDGEPGIGDVPVTIYYDSNGDGVVDPNTDDPFPGAVDQNGVPGGTTTTEPDGSYIFTNLPPDQYVVVVTSPAGYNQTGDPDHFGADAATNPSEAGDNQTTTPVILAAGDVFLNADFGYQPDGVSGAIGDTVWFDENADGTEDAGEEGIAGVTVALAADLNGNGIVDEGEVIATDTTDESGKYLFTGLPLDDGVGGPGADYLVVVTDTDNVLAELTKTDGPNDGAEGNSQEIPYGITLDAGNTSNLTGDFGYTPRGHGPNEGLIGDTIFVDANPGDGPAFNPGAGDTPIEGVLVELRDDNGDVIATTTTNENGNYYFGGLDPTETYTVKVADSNFGPGGVLEGMDNTADPEGDQNNESTTDLSVNGPIDLTRDFGYRAVTASTPGSIGDLVWLDTNADGVNDGPDGLPGTPDDEPGIEGVTLDLYRDLNGNGTVDPGEPKVGTETTDGNGGYLFDGLSTTDNGVGDPGADYIVDVTDEDGVLTGYWHSLGTLETNDNSQEDPYAVSISAGAPDNVTADFGYYVKPAALGNFVWADSNGNGMQDAGEPGIDDVEVVLTAKYADGTTNTFKTLTGDDPSTPGVTEAGWYSFGNLLLDEDTAESTTGTPTATEPVYTLSVDADQAALSGLTPTTANSGTTDLDDSDDFAGVDGLTSQGLDDVTQNADPNAESDPNAGYDFGATNPADYGDAPDTGPGTGPGNYETTKDKNGPSHVVVSGLSLGTVAPDPDGGTLQSVLANADDITATDDEDGVTVILPLTVNSTSYDLGVRATNSSNTAANLVCYLDFNRDGDFLDGGERSATVSVPASSGTANYNVSFGGFARPTAGFSYIRCRLAFEASEAESSTGRANSGEVEDYLVQITETPLSVSLSYFLAEREGDAVNFTWETATETANAGFELLALIDGEAVRVTEQMVPSQVIDSVTTTRYAYVADTDGESFFIELVSISGERSRFGPFVEGETVGQPSVDTLGGLIFLPIVMGQ